MAATLSAAKLSESRRGSSYPRTDAPAPGTISREIYDLFKANEGVPIKVVMRRRFKASLTDTYGLDLICIEPQPLKGGPLWVLAGEWFGSKYIDYIADKIK